MFGLITKVSQWSIPLILILILAAAHKNKVRIYEVFVQGALEGLRTTFRLTPYILAIFVAIGLFRSSGALNLCINIAKPLLDLLRIPPDLLTLALLKPLSGSAALGITADLLQKYGPDSTMGLIASLAQGCSETTFYVLSLYLGSVNIREGRHTLLMGLTSEMAAFFMAISLGSFLFG